MMTNASEYIEDHIFTIRRGHEFESCSGLNFFQAFISQLLKLCITAMINHIFISFSAVQIFDLSYIHLYSSSSTGILRTHVTSSQRLESSVDRALHRYCRGHGFESPSGLNFLQILISQLLKLCV